MRISWNRISDWLSIVFHFGTKNWEELLIEHCVDIDNVQLREMNVMGWQVVMMSSEGLATTLRASRQLDPAGQTSRSCLIIISL